MKITFLAEETSWIYTSGVHRFLSRWPCHTRLSVVYLPDTRILSVVPVAGTLFIYTFKKQRVFVTRVLCSVNGVI